jgi:hypothetical protein
MLEDDSKGDSLLSGGGNTGRQTSTKGNSTNANAVSSPPKVNNEVIQSDNNINEKGAKGKKKSKRD